MTLIRVFISYSHDSESHKERVLELANRLRREGIDAWIDQYELAPPQGWPRWMKDQIEEAIFTLAVCTKTYKKLFEGKDAPGTGLGVQFEGKILTTFLYKAAKNGKIIPVVFSRVDIAFIPAVLSDVSNYDLSQPGTYEKLYRHLTDQPSTPAPPIGPMVKCERAEPTIYILPREYVEEKLRSFRSLNQAPSEALDKLPFRSQLPWGDRAPQVTTTGLLNVCIHEKRGFGALLDALRQCGEPLDELLDLCAVLDDFYCRTVSWAQVLRLKIELETFSIPDKVAQRLYYKVAPTAESISNCHMVAYFTSLLDFLAGMEATRLVEYVIGGLASVGREPNKPVLAILTEIATEHDLDLPAILSRVSESRSTGTESALLYVIVTPDRTRSVGRYQVKVWLRESCSTRSVVDTEDSLEDRTLQKYLPQIILDSTRQLRDPFARLHVEMVLPIELLHLPVEHWFLPIDDTESNSQGDKKSKRLLGVHCPLTVRLYERLYEPMYRWTWADWGDKWSQRPRSRAGEEDVFWIKFPIDSDSNFLEAKALLASLEPMGGPRCRRLQVVLDYGIPVALWLREGDADRVNASKDLRSLVCCEDFDGLPRRLWQRRRGSEGEPCFWKGIALLWDDPGRLPPGAGNGTAPLISPEE